MSTCSKCGGHIFKVQKEEPHGSAFIVYFVQCTSCGVPVGVLEYANSAALIECLERKVDSLEGQIQAVDHNLRVLDHNIQLVLRQIRSK